MQSVFEIILGALISKFISVTWDKIDKLVAKEINGHSSRKDNDR